MRTGFKTALIAAVILSLVGVGGVIAHEAYERHEAHEQEEPEGRRGDKHKKTGNRTQNSSSGVAVQKAYAAACSTCHMLYPAQLLPAASWNALVSQADNHFGQTVPLGRQEQRDILAYLEQNDAFASSSKPGRKMARELGATTPLRITEVPYILHKHRKLDANVFKRPAVGSFSNCKSCHPGAENSDFEDDNARIPAN